MKLLLLRWLWCCAALFARSLKLENSSISPVWAQYYAKVSIRSDNVSLFFELHETSTSKIGLMKHTEAADDVKIEVERYPYYSFYYSV